MAPPLTKAQEDRLKQLYYDQSYQMGIHKLYGKVNDHNNLNISRRQVEDWLKQQDVYQINAPQLQTKHIQSIIASRPFHIIQIDLVDFNNKPSQQYRYIMTVIDVFSRKAWARPITAKETNKTAAALRYILQNFDDMRYESVKLCMTDDGGEFKGQFAQVLAENNIRHIKSIGGLPQTQGIIERFNRTFKTLLLRRQAQLGGNWHMHIQHVLAQYNTTIHSLTKDKPNDIIQFDDSDRKELKDEVTARLQLRTKLAATAVRSVLKDDLAVGDTVRIKVRKGKLDHYSTNNWSPDKYRIIKIITPKEPHLRKRYRLEGESKHRLREDLQKVPE